MKGKDGIEKFSDLSKNYFENKEIRKYMFRNEVSQKILEAMERKEVTKADLAERLQTSRSNVSQILNGDRNITIDKLCELSMILDLIPMFEFKEKEELKSCKIVITDTITGQFDVYADIPHYEGCSFSR